MFADQFDVFEQMHYVCFHYEFEHGEIDPDRECAAGGCPAAPVSPAQRAEGRRDSLVEELIDALATGDMAAESLAFRLERLGPGIVRIQYDDPGSAYLITVRAEPRRWLTS
jgi:hypothetical protein